jgi:hypothetical protein
MASLADRPESREEAAAGAAVVALDKPPNGFRRNGPVMSRTAKRKFPATATCLAVLQAPVIMMSQGRKEAKDRLRAENDYRVNLKAELEIRQLHEKIDHQLARQWERLAELQQIQIELLEQRGSDRSD